MFSRIIAVVGMPRSGTSWLAETINSCPVVRYRLSPLFSYEFKNAVDERSSREEYMAVFRGAYASNNEFMLQADKRSSGAYPVFADKDPEPDRFAFKMTRFHNLIERMLHLFDELKMVAIVRHPCATIHSWLTTPKEFPAGADPKSEWRTGACRKTGPEEFWGFEDWKKVTRLHLRLQRERPEQMRIVHYENFVDDPVEEAQTLFAWLDLPFTDQTRGFLANSHARHDPHTHAVFKSPKVKDRWRTELAPDIQREIVDEIRGTDLERFLE